MKLTPFSKDKSLFLDIKQKRIQSSSHILIDKILKISNCSVDIGKSYF